MISETWRLRASGVPWVLLSGFGFSINAVFVRKAGTILPTEELIFYRALIGIIIISAIMFHKKITWQSTFKHRLWLRGTTGTLSTASYYLSLIYLPLATASTLGNLNGFFLTALGIIFLGERLRASVLGSLTLGLLGIACVLKPDLHHLPMLGASAALSNGLFVALSQFNIRTLHQAGEPEERIMLYFFGLSIFYTWIWIISHHGFHFIPMKTAIYITGMGLSGLLAQWSITRAYREGDVNITSVFSYFNTCFYMLWDWLIWSSPPTAFMILGMFCIAVSGIWVSKR
jgi:drug/metabolite transporter (DMT)-like permease